jgi:hypothetical protein
MTAAWKLRARVVHPFNQESKISHRLAHSPGAVNFIAFGLNSQLSSRAGKAGLMDRALTALDPTNCILNRYGISHCRGSDAAPEELDPERVEAPELASGARQVLVEPTWIGQSPHGCAHEPHADASTNVDNSPPCGTAQ